MLDVLTTKNFIKKDEDTKSSKKVLRKLTKNEILDISSVSISYAKQKFIEQLLNKIDDTNPTVKDINIKIDKGETLALVGESGVESQLFLNLSQDLSKQR